MVEQLQVQEKDTQKNIKNIVDEKTQKQFEDFQKSIKNQTEQAKIVEAFNIISKSTLEMISFDIKNNFISMNEEKIQTYTQVIEAFKQDAKTLNITDYLPILILEIQNRIDLKQIDGINNKARLEELKNFAKNKSKENETNKSLVGELGSIITTIDTKIADITTTETKAAEVENQKARMLLNNKQNIDEFEDNTQEEFNAVIDFLLGTDNTKEINNNNTTNPFEQRLFTLMKKKYTNLTKITIGKADKWFGINFPEGTRLIQWETTPATDNKGNYYTRGDRKYVEGLKAEKAESKKLFEEDIFDAEFNIDGRTGNGKTGMEYFDDENGNFEGLRIYMDKHTSNMQSYLPTIMKGINEYKTVIYEEAETPYATHILDGQTNKYRPIKEDEVATHKEKTLTNLKETEAKNGYANVLTDYMIAHITNNELRNTYLKNINVDTLNILGVDDATRAKNFDRLFFIPEWTKNMDKTEQSLFGSKIKELKSAITGKEETGNSLKTMVENAIDTFGPAVLKFLSMLGIGKRRLMNTFQNSEKIKELFRSEYGIKDPNTINAIEDISKNNEHPDSVWTTDDYQRNYFPSPKKLEDTFKNSKKGYINKLLQKQGQTEEYLYIKYIDAKRFQDCVNFYNQENDNEKMNMNDIVSIDKETKKITGIKNGKDEEFKKILTAYLNNPKLRQEIASTNQSLGTAGDKTTLNEQGIDKTQAINEYGITDSNDTARFITTSLFSSKSLDYVLTENYLQKEKVDTPPPPPAAKQLNINTTYINNEGKLKGITDSVAIHNIFTGETTTRPEKIKVTSGDKVTTAVKKEVTDTDGETRIRTYVAEDEKTLTIDKRVTINNGDKIELVKNETT